VLNKTVVKVSEDGQLLEKLRRLHVIESDEHGEFLWAQVGGDYVKDGKMENVTPAFKMYLGQEVEMPEEFARKLLMGYPVPLDEPCPQCWNEKFGKSTGFTVAGICHQCRGHKFIDLNRTVNTYTLVKQIDGGDSFDPTKIAPPVVARKSGKAAKELAHAGA